MHRRKFISFLAGIVAIPAGIKALFDNQHSVTVKDVGSPEFKGPGDKIRFSFQEDLKGLPTYGDHIVKLPWENKFQSYVVNK